MNTMEFCLRCWVGVCATLLMACGGGVPLDPLDFDRMQQALGAPTGELELADARGIAYTILNLRSVRRALDLASAEIPGVQRSPLFTKPSVDGCVNEVARGVEVDFGCLGDTAGKLSVVAKSELANDNGNYDVVFDRSNAEPNLRVDGTARMRVEGISNPVAVEKTSIAPILLVRGRPRFFEELDRAGIVILNERNEEELFFVIEAQGATFVVTPETENESDNPMRYGLRDVKNQWNCSADLQDEALGSGVCRTPVGQGDFAQLEF